MTAIGGSIEEVTLAGRSFAVAADSDSSRSIGGFFNESIANGDGSARLIKTRNLWKLEGISLVLDDSNGDHKYLQDLANQKRYFPQTFTFASGATLEGTGQIEGDIMLASQTQTSDLSFCGPGNLEQQI